MLSRRNFLARSLSGAGVVGVGAAAPRFLVQAAENKPAAAGENVLVVVQLTGGNDGLNTVVPYDNPEYRRARPELGVAADKVLKIGSGLGFHPALAGFARLLEKSQLAIVQGVGYSNPNRSHFESMDFWHSCRPLTGDRSTGWLGRYLDGATKSGGDLAAVHLGGEPQPLALKTLQAHVPSVHSLEKFRLELSGGSGLKAEASKVVAAHPAEGNDLLQFVQQSKASALVSSRRVEESLGKYQTSVSYPGSELAGKLKIVAQMIDAGLQTRIYYVAIDGFDTHSQQPDAHAGLLTQVGDAVASFVEDVTKHGHGKRVLVMSFSEFGRRVKENASKGTDHGAAAPMFLAGERVKSGLIGAHPSLTDLDDGDLKFHTDFRRVYATVLEKWLMQPAGPIVGEAFKPLELLKA